MRLPRTVAAFRLSDDGFAPARLGALISDIGFALRATEQ